MEKALRERLLSSISKQSFVALEFRLTSAPLPPQLPRPPHMPMQSPQRGLPTQCMTLQRERLQIYPESQYAPSMSALFPLLGPVRQSAAQTPRRARHLRCPTGQCGTRCELSFIYLMIGKRRRRRWRWRHHQSYRGTPPVPFRVLMCSSCFSSRTNLPRSNRTRQTAIPSSARSPRAAVSPATAPAAPTPSTAPPASDVRMDLKPYFPASAGCKCGPSLSSFFTSMSTYFF